MFIKKAALYSSIFLALSSSVPAFAQININLEVGSPPPSARYEQAPRYLPAGYVWVPGYWSWEHNRYVWIDGYKIKDRPGYIWVPSRWERHGKKWHMVRGTWARPQHNGHGYDNDHRNNYYDNYNSKYDNHNGHSNNNWNKGRGQKKLKMRK